MNLKNKKKLAAKMLGVGAGRVWVDPNNNAEMKEAVTREDLRKLVKKGVILVKQKKGVSRARARKNLIQKRKGRRKGPGSRKGKATARSGKKLLWVMKIRLYREFLKTIYKKGLVEGATYTDLRNKTKGGFFRSRRHIILYLNENNLWVKKK